MGGTKSGMRNKLEREMLLADDDQCNDSDSDQTKREKRHIEEEVAKLKQQRVTQAK